MSRSISAAALALALAVSLAIASAAFAMSSGHKLVGTVGPGFTIHLTKNGKTVKQLSPGTYTFAITDKASIHSFVLEREKGGKFERTLTSVAFVGKKTAKIKLGKGTWKYYCAPHESQMHGFFKVK